MKIIFVIESLNMGGAEKSLVTLLQHLPEDEYSIDLSIFNNSGQLISEVPAYVNVLYQPIQLSWIDRVNFKILKLLKKPKHEAQLFRSFALKNLNKPLKNYDVAIAYNQGLSTYYVANHIKAAQKIAWINVDYQLAGYEILKDIAFYKKFNNIVTVSQAAYDSFVSALKQIGIINISPTIIKDISDREIILKRAEAFDPDFKSSLGNIVTVGRLAAPKGYPLALEAAKNLKELKVKFHWHIIGEGPERPSLEALISKYGLKDYITLHGNQNNPYPYIKNADIYVQPSLFEGLGLTVVEASILRKPIICTNFPTAYKIITNDVNGLICEMNAESLTKTILKLLNDNDLQQKLTSKLDSSAESDKAMSLAQFRKLIRS